MRKVTWRLHLEGICKSRNQVTILTSQVRGSLLAWEAQRYLNRACTHKKEGQFPSRTRAVLVLEWWGLSIILHWTTEVGIGHRFLSLTRMIVDRFISSQRCCRISSPYLILSLNSSSLDFTSNMELVPWWLLINPKIVILSLECLLLFIIKILNLMEAILLQDRAFKANRSCKILNTL